MEKIELFDIPILNVSRTEAVRYLMTSLASDEARQVCFVNAHCVNVSKKDPLYMQVLQNADTVFADGAGMGIAAKVLGKPLRDDVNGTDLFPILCQALQNSPYQVFLLGGEPGVAEKMARRVGEQFPGLQTCGTRDGYFDPSSSVQIAEQIRASGAELLLVAMGVPKQELWIAEHLQNLGVKVAMGVGGLFNFYSGTIPRAPYWMRRAKLEWLHRLYREPGRLWRRYLVGNILFLLRLFGERARGR